MMEKFHFKMFNAVFVLICLDGCSDHVERELFQAKVALFVVVQHKNLGQYFGVALFGVELFGVLLCCSKSLNSAILNNAIILLLY